MKTTTSVPPIHEGALHAILKAEHGDPFAVLGMHEAEGQLLVRIFRPDAGEVIVENLNDGTLYQALCVNGDGFFVAGCDGIAERFPYTLHFTSHEGHKWTERDPYSFGTLLGALDLHLFAEGNHFEIYHKLGAHLREIDGVRGTSFHVWAPNAQRVSVVGDFNRWDGRVHVMRKLLGCGVWEIFLPGVS
ncbi:MAG: glgB, partial [Chthoniobacteraceae bacterium]|nr:glgB [Chthoniobacteraceae bacterium]